MANPAPTINQINAFNATQGTTIDFNIIGGTELVRSNRIYIYDLSDNSLICTHLYVSTESIHELPANTDSSIVYESGKSSADFVNGAQYYAQIQTYTDTAGTQGGSGLSVAKMFWCLVDPTLTITTIPSTISTTSYNVSATYNANTSVVSNIIQQYQFNLYSATGSLLQSSGVIVGSGTQQGTSTAYDISYNFTGLSVGSSYYVTVNVTTTQGMNVSTQSNTFTVSIDTPTLGEATVVNNACDGYISVTSNLSSEYGGSASGEIASFVTDSVNNVSSLKVSLSPIQDLHGYDSPWVGGAGKNKWSAGDQDVSVFKIANVDIPAASYNFSAVVTSTDTDSTLCAVIFRDENNETLATLFIDRSTGNSRMSRNLTLSAVAKSVVFYASDSYNHSIGDVATFTDIQLELGNTATAYAPYSNICPIYGHDSVVANVSGVNVWDEEWEVYGANGQVRSKNAIPLVEGATYYAKTSIGFTLYFKETPTGSTISTKNVNNETFVVPQGCHYAMMYTGTGYGSTYKNDISINYPSTDHDYHAYEGDTYTADLPQTVYGGTIDVVSGELVVDRAMIDLGSLTWNWASNRGFFYSQNVNGMKERSSVVCESYPEGVPLNEDCTIDCGYTGWYNRSFMIRNDSYGDDYASFRASLNGINAVYELATPQTIQLTPQEVQTLFGSNNVWSEQGDVDVTYNIPITNLLVKRQDVDDVSGDWLTLYSQPVTQASDMDFTFIDFLNQYGKTYKYALVPLLTQTQSGVEVEVEGGYTVSDEVQSIFDGVFIADRTGLQKCKANVGYGNVDMNQTVGTITPIGAKYPVVITNSKNQYHNGSISGTIVPDDYYFNGNLSRIDMVNKRDELEQFLTNKRAKIIKDWNGKIWLVMIMDNVSCSFNNNYGMGIVNFSTNWVEVGDPTNQQDLQATGLIDVGGA